MDNTLTSTVTTPAMPITDASEDPRRCGMLSKPNRVTDATCINQLMGPAILHSPQSHGDAQAHRLHRREKSSRQTEGCAETQTHDQIA